MSAAPGTRTAAQAVDDARGEGRAALVGYLPVGFPDLDTSVAAMVALARAGCDVLEVGVPYSDPVMDGPVIAAAAHEALAGGTRVADVFAAVRTLREECPGTAVLVMTYWNPVARTGVDGFARRLAEAGGAGLITPDLVPDEAQDWLRASDEHGLERVFLVAPSSSTERLRSTAAACTGFTYAASTMGVTGARTSVGQGAEDLVRRTREAGAARVCVGLGVSTPEQAHEVAAYADGVIVGSALVRALAGTGPDGRAGGPAAAGALAERLAAGVRR
ncbi:tryptophan synthase subunit alpha, partial [Aquipuribacter sp. SD81]|uniref:tryptophan synthase subunit alpha n=1 Tax=Aquipuribacter sp. SD81 TaxID=3127703 RepID=UPI00301B178E